MAKTGLLQFQFQGCSWVVTSLYHQPCDMASLALLQPTKAGLLHGCHFYMGCIATKNVAVSPQNFSVKNGSSICFYKLQTVPIQKPTIYFQNMSR